jgi:predicted DCC family thiol-disulfide oxidoreductase YuxK
VKRLAALWDRFWFAPASLRDLGIARAVIAGGATLLLFEYGRGALGGSFWPADYDAGQYNPLPVLEVLLLPFGWGVRPDSMFLHAVWTLGLVAGAFASIGLFARLGMGGLAYAYTVLVAHQYSYGEYHHPEAIMVIMLWAMCLAPIGAAWSFDALRVRLARARLQVAFRASPTVTTSEFARWPLRLGQILFVLIYFSAAWSKLRSGGLDWMNGTTLAYYLAHDGIVNGLPLGVLLSNHIYLAQVLSVGALAFEATFFLALLRPEIATLYVCAGIAVHLGIYAALGAPFFEYTFLYIVFIEPIRHTLVARRRAPSGSTKRWSVIYDGLCPMCIRTMTLLDAIDHGRRLEPIDFESNWVGAASRVPSLTVEQARQAIHIVAPDGSVHRGYAGFREICRAIPVFRPLSPLLRLEPVTWTGTRLYAWIAAHRVRGLCHADTCGPLRSS